MGQNQSMTIMRDDGDISVILSLDLEAHSSTPGQWRNSKMFKTKCNFVVELLGSYINE